MIVAVLNFYFDLVPSFYLLKLNPYFLTFLLVLASLINPLITARSMTQLTISKISANSILTSSLNRDSENIIINSFLNCFCRNQPLISLMIIIQYLLWQKHLSRTFETILYFLNPLILANQKLLQQRESKWYTFIKLTCRKQIRTG